MQEQESEQIINRDKKIKDSAGNLNLIREYYIFHKDDPENKVKLRTLQTLTLLEIKEKIVRNGLFDREVISELRVERLQR